MDTREKIIEMAKCLGQIIKEDDQGLERCTGSI